jgi:hypothetical protein
VNAVFADTFFYLALLDARALDALERGLDFQRTSLELKAFDVEMPVVATPREIVAKFF